MKKGNILLFALLFASFANASSVLDRIMDRLKGKKPCGCTVKVKGRLKTTVDLTKDGLAQLAAQVKQDASVAESGGRSNPRRAPQRTLKEILDAIKGHECSKGKGQGKRGRVI